MKQLLQLRRDLGSETISNLYMYDCLITSGFTNKRAYQLIGTLNELWVDDPNCQCISGLSDELYNLEEEGVDIDSLSSYEILDLIY
jgi:hypothetical protein